MTDLERRLAALEAQHGPELVSWAFRDGATGLWRVTPQEIHVTDAELAALPGTVYAHETRVVTVGGEDADDRVPDRE